VGHRRRVAVHQIGELEGTRHDDVRKLTGSRVSLRLSFGNLNFVEA
jgi:hypothetical protein